MPILSPILPITGQIACKSLLSFKHADESILPSPVCKYSIFLSSKILTYFIDRLCDVTACHPKCAVFVLQQTVFMAHGLNF